MKANHQALRLIVTEWRVSAEELDCNVTAGIVMVPLTAPDCESSATSKRIIWLGKRIEEVNSSWPPMAATLEGLGLLVPESSFGISTK